MGLGKQRVGWGGCRHDASFSANSPVHTLQLGPQRSSTRSPQDTHAGSGLHCPGNGLQHTAQAPSTPSGRVGAHRSSLAVRRPPRPQEHACKAPPAEHGCMKACWQQQAAAPLPPGCVQGPGRLLPSWLLLLLPQCCSNWGVGGSVCRVGGAVMLPDGEVWLALWWGYAVLQRGHPLARSKMFDAPHNHASVTLVGPS